MANYDYFDDEEDDRIKCIDCEQLFHSEVMTKCEYCEEYRCSYCHEEHIKQQKVSPHD